MSLTFWRRAQDGGYGDGHLDLAILWGENEVAMCLTSTLPQISAWEAENGETADREKQAWFDVPVGTHFVPVGLFHFTSSRTYISTLRAGRGWEALPPRSGQLSGVVREHRADPDLLLLQVVWCKFCFFMKTRELPHALNFIEFYRHGSINSTNKHKNWNKWYWGGMHWGKDVVSANWGTWVLENCLPLVGRSCNDIYQKSCAETGVKIA